MRCIACSAEASMVGDTVGVACLCEAHGREWMKTAWYQGPGPAIPSSTHAFASWCVMKKAEERVELELRATGATVSSGFQTKCSKCQRWMPSPNYGALRPSGPTESEQAIARSWVCPNCETDARLENLALELERDRAQVTRPRNDAAELWANLVLELSDKLWQYMDTGDLAGCKDAVNKGRAMLGLTPR